MTKFYQISGHFDIFILGVYLMQVMLFGASDSYDGDKIMQITVVFNHFGKRLVQRMPRCRFGFVHVVNNDYTYWEMYAIGGSKHPTIISEGNRFIAPHNRDAKEVIYTQILLCMLFNYTNDPSHLFLPTSLLPITSKTPIYTLTIIISLLKTCVLLQLTCIINT